MTGVRRDITGQVITRLHPHIYSKEAKMQELPYNHGKPWTNEQRLRMLKLYVQREMSIEQIAQHMGRIESAILAQFEYRRLSDETGPPTYEQTPLPRDHHRVTAQLANFDAVCRGIHHRGPDDPGGWDETNHVADSIANYEATITAATPNQNQEQDTNKTTDFFATRHYINGIDVADISDDALIDAIRRETKEIASLEALDPMPNRIAKRIDERKAALAAAVRELDAALRESKP